MNLRHIEVFHAVYVNGSVSAAARMLNVSQPSVSKVLRHAESLLGFPLFHRTAGRLIPTDDAHTLFTEVAEIQDRVYGLREASRNLKRGSGALLKISALPAIALDALPSTVAQFLRSHREVKFDLQTIHHEDLLRKLYERETDLAIAFAVPSGSALGNIRLGGGELVVLYSEADMPDAPARIDIGAIEGHPLITLAASGPIGQLFSAEVQARGIVLDEVVSARTFHIATALVRQGVGLTVVDNFTAQASLAPGLSMRPLANPLRFDVHAMYLHDRPPTALATTFLKALARKVEAISS